VRPEVRASLGWKTGLCGSVVPVNDIFVMSVIVLGDYQTGYVRREAVVATISQRK
jgi:hypothetical protein